MDLAYIVTIIVITIAVSIAAYCEYVQNNSKSFLQQS